MDTVELRFLPGVAGVTLRELTGHQERAVGSTGTADALALIDALVRPASSDPLPAAADWVAADRDRVLAAIYQRAFGDRIDNTLACKRCSHPFDIHFSLAEMQQRIAPVARVCRATGSRADLLLSEAGVPFRLPTGREELAWARLPGGERESALLLACLPESHAGVVSPAQLEEFFEQAAPLLDLELGARCPDCGHQHNLQFDVQSYLLAALLAEKPRLLSEIHRLALAYGWSHAEILALPRSERKQFMQLLEGESASRTRRFH